RFIFPNIVINCTDHIHQQPPNACGLNLLFLFKKNGLEIFFLFPFPSLLSLCDFDFLSFQSVQIKIPLLFNSYSTSLFTLSTINTLSKRRTSSPLPLCGRQRDTAREGYRRLERS